MKNRHQSNEEIITSKLAERKCDEIQVLNLPEIAESPRETFETIQRLLAEYKRAFVRDRNDAAFAVTLDQVCQLGPLADGLDKRLQEHVQVLRQTESTTKQPNAVLEIDMAKRRADKLAEILRAKKVWISAYEELQYLDASDIALRHQKLVALQQSFDVLRKYSLKRDKVDAFERMKDEFLSWYSPATILAIDTNDLKQLEAIKEKYISLDRVKVFESNFGNYIRNKMKCYLEDESRDHSLWAVLQQFFGIWKQCTKIVDLFVEENESESEILLKNLEEGIMEKWDTILGIISKLVEASENPFVAAKTIGKTLSDFSNFVEKEGDEGIFALVAKLSRKIFEELRTDYGKHATSLLLCTINKITAPEKSSRHQHNWLMPYLEDIQSSMRDIVNEARNAFGPEFSAQIVPAFEHGVREINSLLQNQDILNIRPEGIDIRKRKSVQENTEDKVSAICATGYLINMLDDINEYIREMALEMMTAQQQDESEPPRQITNSALLETLNLRVVSRKIESIGNTIIHTMEEEMDKLKQESEGPTQQPALADPREELSFSLPSFSIAPQNYVTNVGHGLLSQMNVISAYNQDRNFVRAITSAASETNSPINTDETDLWLLTEVAKMVQNAFCNKVGNAAQLQPKLRRQFNVDIVFLMEALADLRLQPTAQISKLSEELREAK